MPIARFQMPDGRVARFEVPDGTTPEQAQAMIQDALPKVAAPTDPLKIGKAGFADSLRDVLQSTDWGTRNIAGAGTALSNVWQGIKQFSGKGDRDAIEANQIIRDEAPVGAFAGDVALTAAPFAAAGTSLRAAGAVGAGFGALQPVAGEQTVGNVAQGKVMNTALGGLLGAGGQALANKGAAMVQNKLADLALKKSQNAELDATLQAARQAGYVVPPSYMPDSGVAARVAEGVSGKYKTNQLAGIRNQQVTDTLARRAVGLADDAPLTSQAMQQIRRDAYQAGYAPLETLGTIKTDATFTRALDNLVANRKMAAKSFPDAVKDEITPFVESMKVAQFDAGDAIKMTQILRDEATAAYKAGDNAVGQVKRSAAKALEDQIERTLSLQGQQGADMLKAFRDARTLMAKAHTIEDAIREGGGRVDAKALGRRVQAGKPMTAELETAGKFANNFGDVSGVPKSGHANPFTIIDAGYTLPAGAMNPLAYGLPLARVAARYGLLSDMAQNAMAAPSYSLGMLPRVAGGLLQYSPVGATALGLPALAQ